MDNVMIAATVIAPIVLILTQVYKNVFGASKVLPLVNLLIGIIAGGIWALSFADTNLVVYLWAGFFAGASAGGLYDLGANAKAKVNENQVAKLEDQNRAKQDLDFQEDDEIGKGGE